MNKYRIGKTIVINFKIILFIGLIINNISCSSDKYSLENDKAIQLIFNEEEISSLKLIVQFFDEYVSAGIRRNNLNDSYHSFIESIKYVDSVEDLERKLNLDQDGVDNLILILKEKRLSDEVWQYDYGYHHKSKDTLSISLAPNFDAKYWRFIDVISQNNITFKEYKTIIEVSGNIPPGIVAGFQNIHDKFDFNYEINRLIWAVHFITIFSSKKYNK